MKHIQPMVNMYHNAPINKIYSPKLTIKEIGKAMISYTINPDHFHAAGFLHGSAIFKLLDDSAFFAAQSIEQEFFIVTASYNSHFIRPVNDGKLTGLGQIIETTKSQIIAESRIENESGKLIAHGSGIFMKSTTPISSLNTESPK